MAKEVEFECWAYVGRNSRTLYAHKVSDLREEEPEALDGLFMADPVRVLVRVSVIGEDAQ